jgi:hypothetical protein
MTYVFIWYFDISEYHSSLYQVICVVYLSHREIDLKAPENQSIYCIMTLIFKSFHGTDLLTLMHLNQGCSGFHI